MSEPEAIPAGEHLEKAVHGAPIGIVCVAGAKGRYVFANETFARMIGRTQPEVMASDPYEISVEATHPDDRVISREAIEHLAQGKSDTFRYEKRLLHKDGSILWVAVDMLATRDPEGRLAFLTLYFTDIHEQRSADAERQRLETELRHAQKLEALGRLAGGVAHDFNNRLAVIMGYAEILKERLPMTSPLVGHTEMVLESAKRASELTRQLLAYSRRQVLQPQVVDLNSVVDQMRPWLERLIGEDIELTTSLAADYPILSDRGQIEQVIMNLAINARDAMPRGGRLTLETKSVTLTDHDSSAMPKGDCVALVMSDSGAGIAEDVLPRVFEPFFTTKDVGRGTGLGLATVEGIVHQSGGSVRVESVIGQGTTFTILLPRASEAQPQARPPAQIPIARGPDFETVLVCDDDDGVRELVANVLKLRAYTVLKARNGKHALAVAEEHQRPIHLLVTDLVMPELGGIELASELRRKHAQLCVLYISGYTEDVTIVSGQLAPGTSFLPKPFLPSELTRSVCSILEGPQAG